MEPRVLQAMLREGVLGRDVSGDHGALPGSAADLCVANHFSAHPCLLSHLTLLSARSYFKCRRKADTTHSTM